MTMPTFPGLTYVTVFGTRISAKISPTMMAAMRRIFGPSFAPLLSGENPTSSSRSVIVLVMNRLLVAIGAHHCPAGEAYQIGGRARPVNRAHQLSRAIDSPPIERLLNADAHWCVVEDHDEKEGGHRRDQRDEQHAIDENGSHNASADTTML